ncbi:MAG: ABC transporter ATP-binding protein, partial [Anaerolineae bacterium]
RCSRVGLMYQGQLIVCDVPDKIKGLVPGELLELRPLDLRRAEQVVAAADGVLEVQTYGDLLHVFVDSAAGRQESLLSELGTAEIEVIGLRQIRPRMEEAFISLVREQMEESGELA